MRAKGKKSSQHSGPIIQILQQSTVIPLDLKQLLETQEFQYTNLEPKGPSDYFIAMTPYMVGKFSKYRKAVHFVMWNDGIDGLNGKRNIAMLLTLNSNLQPSILTVGIARNQQTDQSDMLYQMLLFVSRKCEIDFMILYCNHPQTIENGVELYNRQQEKHIQLEPSYSAKQGYVKQILLNSKITKKPYLKKQAFQLINLILEEKDQKKFHKTIQKFKQWNQEGYDKIMSQDRKFKFVYELPQYFYGFSLLKKYDNEMQNFIKKYQKQNFENQSEFINRIIQQEYHEMELKRVPCQDQWSLFEFNSRVKQLQSYIEPNPMKHFLQNYQRSLSFKQTKISQTKYTVGGKVGSSYQVTRLSAGENNRDWACECSQSVRLGIPCEHLLKICCVEKLSFQDQIDSIYHIGHQKPYLRLD